MRLTQKGGKNLGPVDGKDFHGWPVDNVVYMQRNDSTASAARSWTRPSLDWQASRLGEGAELYPTLPIHDNDNKLDTKRGARVMSQTLSEAGWLVPLAFGYDLVRDAGTSNWQSWHNAALLAVGILMKNDELVKLALDGPGGFRWTLARRSVGYHFFALNPLLLTREMATREGIALRETSQLNKMLDAPLACVFPDGTLPNCNDSGRTRLASDSSYFEIGYRLFHEERYGLVIKDGKRGIESLLWGAEKLPSAAGATLASELLPAADTDITTR